MGNAQAKEPIAFSPGIEVKPGLLAQLQGRPHRRTSSLKQSVTPHQQITPALEEEVVKLLQRDQELRLAYEKSRIAGNLLLKNEAEELQRVGQYADDLIAKEYSAPSGEPPCTLQQTDALQCYRSHAQDPLACAGFVDAYVACAQGVRQKYAASHNSRS